MPTALRNRLGPILILLLLILTALPGRAASRRFALLPLSDLSIDYNGIDLETTQELSRIMEDLGFEAVPAAEIYRFMAEQQIYDAGFLNAFNARKLGSRLDCQLILTGTVIEEAQKEREPGRFGLLLNGFSGASGKIVFTLDLTSAEPEEVTFLALGEPRSQAELKALVMARVARRLARLTASGLPGREATASGGCPCEITRFSLDPDYVQSGRPVTVTVRLNCLDRLPERVKIVDESGQKLVLEPTDRPGEYRGRLTAAASEGPHSLGLEIYSGRAEPEPVCRESDFSGYRVSNRPPPVTVELKQGLPLDNGATIFSRQLLVVSHYPREIPIDRWQVEVTRPDGAPIFQEVYDGELPHRMYWQGWDNKHQLLDEGSYNFILRVWDRAGNRAEVSKKVVIQRTCVPVVVGTAKDEQGVTRLLLNAATAGPRNLLKRWHLSLYTADGKEILGRSGKKLPAAIELPGDLKGDYVRCELEARDRIGNRFVLAEERVFLPGREPGRKRDQRLQLWNKDF
jgi:hypothetical protein